MKKKLLFITLILFSISAFTQQQFSGRVYYTISTKPFNLKLLDSVNDRDKKLSPKMKNLMKEMLGTNDNVTGILQFTNNEMLYRLDNAMLNESNRKFNMTKIIAGNNDIFYRNKLTNEDFKQSNTYGEKLLIEQVPLKWKITQESKKINKFFCYKATAIKEIVNSKGVFKREITAWFTPEIPFPFGPSEFGGLPGLILEIESEKINYVLQKIILNPKNKITIKKPNKGKKMSAVEFFEMTKRLSESMEKRIKRQ